MPTNLTYPRGPSDTDGIREYANNASFAARSYRLEMQRIAQRNILYYLGLHWIKYDTAIRFWRPIAIGRRTPRPVTNRIAPLVNQSVANILNFRPPTTYAPVSDRPDDVAAATVADRVNSIIEREAGIEAIKPIVARWLTTTGNVFLINNYDTSPDAGTDFIQSEQCQSCQSTAMPLDIVQAGNRCPTCQAPGPFQPATDENGTAQGIDYPRGRFLTEVETVFTTIFDNAAGQTIYDSPYFMTIRQRNKDWITRMYGEAVAEKVSYNQPVEPLTGLFEALAYATSLWSYGYGTPMALSEPRARVRRLWVRPRPGTAPEGIYAVLVDDDVVEAGPWPYKDDTGRPFLNVVHIGFDEVPGRILYKTRVDDVVPKQDQRNRLEAIAELHALRMANALWLVPEGVGLSKITGEQGQLVRYNALQGVPPPQRISGDSLSPYIIQWMGLIDQEMDSIFGLYEVGRGEAPRGISAYSALQLLDERAQQGQSGIMRNWALGWLEWSRQNLHIWRQCASDDRYLSTGAGQWSIQKFNKAALRGGINITAEIGQFRPQTMTGRRALFEQGLRLGLVNPADPMEAYQVLQAMGIPEIMPDFKIDLEHASRNVDLLVNGQTPPPPDQWENNAIALSVFRRFIQSEQFSGLDPMIQERIRAYAGVYFFRLQQAMMMQQRQPGTITPGPEGAGHRGAGGDQNLGTEEGQRVRDQQLPTHPEMTGMME